jgi:uncharacterized protein (UPF0548 family)
MFLLHQPSEETVRQFIASQCDLAFSYSQVGGTQSEVPMGYTVDHNRIKLGEGNETYRRAVAALRSWKHFDLGWVTIVPPQTEVVVGATVAIQAKTFGLWSLSACRVVYLIDEDPAFKGRFGFAYGTLPDHVERGEERFTIEWRHDDSVWYDIFAFSRPHQFLVRLAFPLARRLQLRFAGESLAAMVRASG